MCMWITLLVSRVPLHFPESIALRGGYAVGLYRGGTYHEIYIKEKQDLMGQSDACCNDYYTIFF